MTSPCTDDASCPGPYVCFAGVTAWNATGSALPGVLPEGCWCSNWYGNAGPECSSWSTPVGLFWVSVSSLNAAGHAVAFLVTAWELVRFLRFTPARARLNSHIVCLLLLLCGFGLTAVGESLFAIQPTRPHEFIVFNGEKAASLHVAAYVPLMLGFFAVLLALAVMALMWLRNGMQLLMRDAKEAQRALLGFQVVLYSVQAVLILVVGITFFLGISWTVATAFIAAAYIFAMCGIIVVGYASISKTMLGAIPDASPERRETMHRIMLELRGMLARVLTASFAAICLFTTASSVNLEGWKNHVGPPESATFSTTGPTRLCPTSILGIGCVVLSYLHHQVQRKVSHLGHRDVGAIQPMAFAGKLITLVDSENTGEAPATVSVLCASTLPVDERDTAFTLPPSLRRVICALERWNWGRRFVSLGWSSLLATLVIAVVVGVVPVGVGFAFSVLTLSGSIAVLAWCTSRSLLLSHLVRTWYFVAVTFTILVNSVLLGLALSDARASVVVGLTAMQLVTFTTDALVFPRLRSLLVLNSLLPTLALVVAVTFNLVPSIHNVVLPIGISGYSLLQALRDSMLLQVVQFATELLFVWRGRDQHRFMHLARPVEAQVVSMKSDDATQRVHRTSNRVIRGNASTVLVQSGFFFRQASAVQNDEGATHIPVGNPEPATRRVTCVFVNKVVVKQRSCLAVRVLGDAMGEHVFDVLDSPTGRVANELCLLAGLVIVCVLPFVPGTDVAWVTLPFMAYVVLHAVLTSSASLLRLLVRRVAFAPAVVFATTWLGFTSYVLRDARALVAVFCYVTHVLTLLSDAQTLAKPMHRVMRVLTAIRGSAMMAVLSVYLITDTLPRVDHAVIRVASSQDGQGGGAETVDFAQQCGDWGLFAFALPGLHHVVLTAWDVWHRHTMTDTFRYINSPIAPLVVGAVEQAGVVPVSEESDLNELREMLERGGGEDRGGGTMVEFM